LVSVSAARITTVAAKAATAIRATASSARTALKELFRTTAGWCRGMTCPMTLSSVVAVVDIGGHAPPGRFQRGNRPATAW
jgi:hypothetical protein